MCQVKLWQKDNMLSNALIHAFLGEEKDRGQLMTQYRSTPILLQLNYNVFGCSTRFSS